MAPVYNLTPSEGINGGQTCMEDCILEDFEQIKDQARAKLEKNRAQLMALFGSRNLLTTKNTPRKLSPFHQRFPNDFFVQVVQQVQLKKRIPYLLVC